MRLVRNSVLALALCSGCATTSAPDKQVDPVTEPVAGGEGEDDAPAFTVEVKDWEGPAGKEGQVTVIVRAKPGFHINEKYPQKVKLDDPPAGLTVPAREIGMADAKLEGESSLTYTILATADKAGEYQLTGVVKLGVCSAEMCKNAKEKVAAKVTAQ